MMEYMDFEHIEKEDVKKLNFPKEEILEGKDAVSIRRADVQRAITLGNLEHHKVKIYFADETGNKVVNTTIWAVTDEVIVLKQHVTIPTNRIIKLEI